MTANLIDLTWLSVVKDRAGIKGPGQDAEIQAAITGFSKWVLSWAEVPTLNSVATLTEIYDGNGNDRLYLRGRPVLSVSSVTANGTFAYPVVNPGDLSSSGVFIEDGKRSIAIRMGTFAATTFSALGRSFYLGGLNFPIGTGNIQVAYSCGYPPVTIFDEVNTITNQTITLQVQPWVADAGVVSYPSLSPLVKVANSPASGQYAVTVNGLYVFNVADNGLQVAVSYQVNQAPFDLETAVRNIVAINAIRKSTLDLSTRGTTSAGTNATTGYRNWAWPPEYQKVLDNYQRKSLT